MSQHGDLSILVHLVCSQESDNLVDVVFEMRLAVGDAVELESKDGRVLDEERNEVREQGGGRSQTMECENRRMGVRRKVDYSTHSSLSSHESKERARWWRGLEPEPGGKEYVLGERPNSSALRSTEMTKEISSATDALSAQRGSDSCTHSSLPWFQSSSTRKAPSGSKTAG